VKIAPSVLSADFAYLGEQVRSVEEAGADFLHIDVMDGHFVPNITIGPLVVRALKKVSKLVLDVHLMIESPDRYIDDFAEAGADIITVHAEACIHLHRTLQMIKQRGLKAGLAFNPATEISGLDYVLPLLDLVLVMTVNPGFGGQKLIEETLPKIAYLSQYSKKQKSDLWLEVDGGVNATNAGEIVKAGANVLVAGSAVFATDDPGQAVRELRVAAGGQ